MDNVELDLLEKFKEKKPGARLLAFFKTGSHFFDLNTENSDKDFRGVYLPSAQELKTQKLNWDPHKRKYVWCHGLWEKQFQFKTNGDEVKNKKNTKDDVDCNFYSLDEFLNLLVSGDFNMLELLYAPENKILLTSPEFEELRFRRSMFYPVSLKSFLGFTERSVRIAAYDENTFEKYTEWLIFLKTLPLKSKLIFSWDKLVAWNLEKKLGQLKFVYANQHQDTKISAFFLANRLWVSTARVEYLIEEAEDMLSGVSYRKKEQSLNPEKYQPKALSHALRLLFEVDDLIRYGELRFPFDAVRHKTLKDVKSGVVTRDKLFQILEERLSEVQAFEDNLRLDEESFRRKMDNLLRWGEFFFLTHKQRAILNNFKD